MPKCKSCPASIRFCRTAAGKWMPIDADPNVDGNVFMTGTEIDGIAVVAVVDLFTPREALRYMPHWATCPAADESR